MSSVTKNKAKQPNMGKLQSACVNITGLKYCLLKSVILKLIQVSDRTILKLLIPIPIPPNLNPPPIFLSTLKLCLRYDLTGTAGVPEK